MPPSEADKSEGSRDQEVETDHEEEEEFVDSLQDLNESQTKELIEILKRVEEEDCDEPKVGKPASETTATTTEVTAT